MRNKILSISIGCCLAMFGLFIVLNTFNLIPFSLFFEGWWTLFLIIPGIAGLFGRGSKFPSLILLVVGVSLLLDQQNVIQQDITWKIIFALVIILVGIRIMFSPLLKKRHREDDVSPGINIKGHHSNNEVAFFSSSRRVYNNEVFNGSDLTAVFGSVTLDLRNAIIEQDSSIDVTSLLGGCEILVPSNVNIKVDSTNILGSTDNKSVNFASKTHTIFVDSTAILGSVEIK